MWQILSLLIFGLPVLLVILTILFIRWLLAEVEDPDGKTARDRKSSSFFGIIKRWLSKPVPKLTYRRDRKGRFRKIRRG